MKGNRIAAVIVLLVLVLGVGVLLARSKSMPRNPGVQIVAAENFWGNIAQQLGGTHAHVTSIITDPNADPHLYESSAQNAAAVASARVVIENGMGYDDFMSKLLGGSQNSQRQVLSAQQILGEPDGANQHLWYDTTGVEAVAARITGVLSSTDPAHKSDYQQNLTTFDDSLKPLLTEIAQLKQQYAGVPVAYTEPVPGYTLAAAGLDVKTPEGFAKSIEDGDDPSPADAAAMDSLMTGKQIRVLLYNSQATSPVTEHVKALARQNGIPVVGVTETLPPKYKNFQAWQKDQLDQISKALENKS